ncbi:MFS transporter [Nocardia macrotermitis]|uniref:Putative niacin/nicotinamide transporter NaiP n=1 Tax=Nocardia macrotermitis TaxID=2585198 RepID=A0A7K0D1R3_9NOCA|nr:MFS transporter [Nocardia macrotermitis]MQY18894.1 putative niacin/nicotinamide transporter NaiP [Nocardia macrotermitis]
MTSIASAADTAAIAARLERLPISRWHIKARIAVGAVTFFDGFDQLMIAYAMPKIAKQWHLTTTASGWVIAAGGIGMLIGSLLGGRLADRIGRMPVVIGSMVLYSLMSLGMAMSSTLALFVVFRFVQGLGLGAEVPVATCYIGEISKARHRGRFVLLYETIFPVGLLLSSIASSWVVPHVGYRWLFVTGLIPIVLLPILLRLPESPRWLTARGRIADADAAMTRIEQEITASGKILPPPEPVPAGAPARAASLLDLFRGRYLRHTAVIGFTWLTTFFVNYGLTSWLPTLYTGRFHVSLTTALHYSVITTLVGVVGCVLVALLIDGLGRRMSIAFALGLAAALLFLTAAVATGSAFKVMLWCSASSLFVFSVTLALYLYTTEVFPTSMRALGVSFGGACGRLGAVLGPLLVGWLLDHGALHTLFAIFGAIALAGALIFGLFAMETKEKTLEEITA